MTKEELKHYNSLTTYLTTRKVKEKVLPIPVETILKGLEEGKTQSMLARELHRSKSAVSQRISSMRKKGLLPTKMSKLFATPETVNSYDKRNHSLKWKLGYEVKLPLDDSNKVKGLERGYRELRGKAFKPKACYFVNTGTKGARSLEIFGGEVGGKTPEEVNLRLVYEALNIYKWLCSYFPELEKASGGLWSFEVNRKGELNDLNGAELARIALEQTGSSVVYFGNPPRFKADCSKGYPELQELPDVKLEKRLGGIEAAISKLSEKQDKMLGYLERLAVSQEKLIEFITPKEPKKEPEPPPLPSDETMFR